MCVSAACWLHELPGSGLLQSCSGTEGGWVADPGQRLGWAGPAEVWGGGGGGPMAPGALVATEGCRLVGKMVEPRGA